MSRIFFTSDTHFGHNNVIRFCNRPFANAYEMDVELTRRWNEVVNKDDTVYHLGDFAFRNKTHVSEYLAHLNGIIHLVTGGHDKKGTWKYFASFDKVMQIKVGKQTIVLCHYPMVSWEKSHYGSWMLYGHTHGRIPYNKKLPSFDIGTDCWNYTPISFEEVADILG